MSKSSSFHATKAPNGACRVRLARVRLAAAAVLQVRTRNRERRAGEPHAREQRDAPFGAFVAWKLDDFDIADLAA